jgi:hypothetical protein
VPNYHRVGGDVTDQDRAELARLSAYVQRFTELLALHARTPDRWKYFQTEWIWRYVRGMVEGRTAQQVYDARIAALGALDAEDEVRKNEELVALHRSTLRVIRGGSRTTP